MPGLIFFSRVAFLCNLSFLVAMIFTQIPWPVSGPVASYIILLGLVVAPIVNGLVCLVLLFLLLRKKPVRQIVPVWLIIANFLFLTAEIIGLR